MGRNAVKRTLTSTDIFVFLYRYIFWKPDSRESSVTQLYLQTILYYYQDNNTPGISLRSYVNLLPSCWNGSLVVTSSCLMGWDRNKVAAQMWSERSECTKRLRRRGVPSITALLGHSPALLGHCTSNTCLQYNQWWQVMEAYCIHLENIKKYICFSV